MKLQKVQGPVRCIKNENVFWIIGLNELWFTLSEPNVYTFWDLNRGELKVHKFPLVLTSE